MWRPFYPLFFGEHFSLTSDWAFSPQKTSDFTCNTNRLGIEHDVPTSPTLKRISNAIKDHCHAVKTTILKKCSLDPLVKLISKSPVSISPL